MCGGILPRHGEKSLADYSNLQIKKTATLSYQETPEVALGPARAHGPAPPAAIASNFPWYYAGLITAVVRIAIKLSNAINEGDLKGLTAKVAAGQDPRLD